MKRFSMQRSKAYQRLAVLTDAHFVRHEDGVRCPRVYLATVTGLTEAGMLLPRAKVSAASCAHDLALVDVAIPLELSPSLRIVTEREMRRAGTGADNPYQLRVLDGVEASGHWPDLVVRDVLTDKLTAIEVELTLKRAGRINHKLRAYMASPYSAVRYICGPPNVAKVLHREVGATRMGGMIKVERLERAIAAQPRSAEHAIDTLTAALEEHRQQAVIAAGQVAHAATLAESERLSALKLVDEIGRYLHGDRPTRKSIQERWTRLVEAAQKSR